MCCGLPLSIRVVWVGYLRLAYSVMIRVQIVKAPHTVGDDGELQPGNEFDCRPLIAGCSPIRGCRSDVLQPPCPHSSWGGSSILGKGR
jgi:hypothetical protein